MRKKKAEGQNIFMKKCALFKGVATAVITPFDNDRIDYWRFSRFLEFQLTEGTDAIVVCGTTREASTDFRTIYSAAA